MKRKRSKCRYVKTFIHQACTIVLLPGLFHVSMKRKPFHTHGLVSSIFNGLSVTRPCYILQGVALSMRTFKVLRRPRALHIFSCTPMCRPLFAFGECLLFPFWGSNRLPFRSQGQPFLSHLLTYIGGCTLFV